MTVCWRRGWTWPRCMSISSLSRTSPGGSLASIVKALTLGGRELAVDGVLLIGEHGDYAWNEREQQLYPRKYFMEQICGVIARSGRAITVFSDKHLSYNWHDAKWMYERARQLGIPFMAGSSLPFGWRSPWLELEI